MVIESNVEECSKSMHVKRAQTSDDAVRIPFLIRIVFVSTSFSSEITSSARAIGQGMQLILYGISRNFVAAVRS